MNLTFQYFVCFGIPLFGILLYAKLFENIEDNVVFKIGLINTINYLLWFSQVWTIRFWGMSGMNILLSTYLMFIAPILALGFSYWLLINKKILAQYLYALTTSIAYIAIITLIFIIFIVVLISKS